MSILIKGMEMPKTCKECIFSRYILGEWFCRTTTALDDDGMELWETVGENGNSKRADFCPLTPVPPHGDLIDRRELVKNDHQHYEYLCDEFYVTVRDIENAPAIIPAEPPKEEK